MALEAALTFPILLLILLGIIELTFLMRDHAVVVSDTSAGRAHRVHWRERRGRAPVRPVPSAPPCVPANVPALAQQAADAIQRAGSAMPVDQIQYLLVYKANSEGYPGADSNTTMPTSCSGFSNCVMFKWRPTPRTSSATTAAPGTPRRSTPASPTPTWTGSGSSWSRSTRTSPGLFGSYLTLDDHAVMNFEPLPAQICGSGTHA